MTSEVLRKLCPLEAELLKDPTIKAKVRFRLLLISRVHLHILCTLVNISQLFLTALFDRFTGTEFPPKIVFKVFISSGGFGIKYFSGKKVITPASEVS